MDKIRYAAAGLALLLLPGTFLILPLLWVRRRRMLALAALALASVPSWGQNSGASGEDVVDVVCAGCHGTGVQGAPKIGDREAWAKRAAQGFATLTRNALQGVCNTPPRGGDAGVGDLELRRAIVSMVNKSGGNWIEPASYWELAGERNGAEIVQTQCAQCHELGFAGAPRIGDRVAWSQRLRLGMDRVVRSAIRGRGEMPPRGGQPNLTDAELRSAVIYMASPARKLAMRSFARDANKSQFGGDGIVR